MTLGWIAIGAVASLVVWPLVRLLTDVLQGRTADELRRRRRGRPSEYDGHEDYLEDVETPTARLKHWLVSGGNLVAAVLGGLTIAYQLDVPGLEVASSGPLGVPFLLFSLVVLIVAAGITGALVHWLNTSFGYFVGYGVSALAFVLGFMLPLQAEREATAAAVERRIAAVERFESADGRARAKWIADVEAAGAHGSGEPPMLKVEDRGATLLITNITDRDLECVEIARVWRDATMPGGFARCPLAVASTSPSCRLIRAGNSDLFEPSLSDARCAAGELEFRIGSYTDPEPSWWSTMALRDFERRTEQPDR